MGQFWSFLTPELGNKLSDGVMYLGRLFPLLAGMDFVWTKCMTENDISSSFDCTLFRM